MAKKQSFGDKVEKKKGAGKDHIKLIRTSRSAKSGSLRFYEEMVRVPDGKGADGFIKDLLSKDT